MKADCRSDEIYYLAGVRINGRGGNVLVPGAIGGEGDESVEARALTGRHCAGGVRSCCAASTARSASASGTTAAAGAAARAASARCAASCGHGGSSAADKKEQGEEGGSDEKLFDCGSWHGFYSPGNLNENHS